MYIFINTFIIIYIRLFVIFRVSPHVALKLCSIWRRFDRVTPGIVRWVIYFKFLLLLWWAKIKQSESTTDLKTKDVLLLKSRQIENKRVTLEGELEWILRIWCYWISWVNLDLFIFYAGMNVNMYSNLKQFSIINRCLSVNAVHYFDVLIILNISHGIC